MKLAFDIEANGLPGVATKIWCIVIYDLDTNTQFVFDYQQGNVEEGVAMLEKADVLIGHNVLGYDAPVLEDLYGLSVAHKCHDTFILSQMLCTNDMRTHSIEEWGVRLHIAKFKAFPEKDWWMHEHNIPEMKIRCISDTKILVKLYRFLTSQLTNIDWKDAIKLEYDCQHLYVKHNRDGVGFDIKLAHRLVKILLYLQGKIDRDISRLAGLFVNPIGNTVTPFKKDSSLTKQAQVFLLSSNIDPTTVAGEFTRIQFQPINLNSTKQKIDWLHRVGWRPDTWNYEKDATGRLLRDSEGNRLKKSPSLSGSSFLGVPDNISEQLIRYNLIGHRLGVISGWINSQKDGVIFGGAKTCGTATARFTHSGIANVPRAEEGKYLGKYMRALFQAQKGEIMVGFDFKSLEARVEGHYTSFYDGGEYANWLLNCGDLHQFHADLWNVPRSEAKVYGYALSYRCGPAKIADYGKPMSEAQMIHRKFWEVREPLVKLIEDLENALVDRGQARRAQSGHLVLNKTKPSWIRTIDGRPIFLRSAHSINNYLIQSAGSILVKHVFVGICKELEAQNIPMSDIRVPIVYHDELQAIVRNDEKVLDSYYKICNTVLNRVNEKFKLKVPLEIEFKSGPNWATTH